MIAEPTEERPRRAIVFKHYTKYFILALVCCLSVIVIPVVFVVYCRDPEAKRSHEDFSMDYAGKAKLPPLPWYTARGVIYPKDTDGNLTIWPEEDESDRIEEQLMLMYKVNASAVKIILMYHKLPKLSFQVGQDSFFGCPVQSCSFSDDMKDIEIADAVLFTDDQYVFPNLRKGRPSHQVWVLFLMENPYHTTDLDYLTGLINWTASYRSDSDIVVPFSKWVCYNHTNKELPEDTRNFAAGKTKKVVWFVKGFGKDHSERKEYVEELQKYIDIDVFGRSKDHQCPCLSPQHCFQLLDQYKFILAFESAHCRDFITTKFFTSLQRGVLPVVMGPPPEDYLKAAPDNSFIHVDQFSSPKLLAEYLHELDRHDDLYNAYFRWRGTGEMIDTRVECRLCALLHSGKVKNYTDVNSWWRKNVCTGQGNRENILKTSI